MSSDSSTEARQRFYEKAYLAGLINFVVGRREETGDRHPMLRLHECLATICVAKAREVVACYIEAAVGSRGRSKLHMSRNDKWVGTAKDYVARVLGILAKMSSAGSSTPFDQQRLQKEVYAYCKEKVEHRIAKFLRTVKSVLEEDLSKPIKELFPHDTEQKSIDRLQKIVDVIKADLEKLQRQLGATTPPSSELLMSLPEKSEACRTTAAKWERTDGVLEVVREKFPYIEKRMLKVASYNRSIDVLSEWAKGAGAYAESSIKQAYPVPVPMDTQKPDHITYSTPTTQQPAGVMGRPLMTWDAIAKKYYPQYATDAALKKLTALNTFLGNTTKPPTKPLYLHAEMHFVQTLLSLNPPPKVVYIGISKLCCYLCYHCIRTVNDIRSSLINIHVKGTHNKIYNTWLSPSTFPDAPELAALESKLDALNRATLQDPKTLEHGTDESAPVSSLPARA